MNFMGLLVMGGGIFAICGATCDWDWFMGHHKAKLLVAMLGRNGARVFYALFGAVLAVAGLLMLLGIIENSSR